MFVSRTGEPVQPEIWQWIAEYEDGTKLYQFDTADGRFHNFDEIDQARIKTFSMANGQRTITLSIPTGVTLIHFYDTIVQQPQDGTPVTHRLYGFGYKAGKSHQRLWMILPGGFIVETDDQNKIGVV